MVYAFVHSGSIAQGGGGEREGEVLISRVNGLHHRFVKAFIRDDDVVVDCTLGNGHDALFLAGSLGRAGHLFGFDVQEEAVERSREHLLAAGIGEERFTLIRASHEEIAEHVPRGIGVAMYNLGYLPGGDRGIVTDRTTTIASIGKTLGLLRRGGVTGVTLYYGHDGGRREADGVLDYVAKLDQKRYTALHLHYLNLRNSPPAIVFVQQTL